MYSVWSCLLELARGVKRETMFEGKRITLEPGQLVTGRKKISTITGIHSSSVQRLLKRLEIEQQIEQQTGAKSRLITIVNWNEYHASEQQNEQQANNKRTTTEQQANTIREVKELKEVKEIIEHLNGILGTKYRPTTKATVRLVNGRLREGYTVEDFKTVHAKKCKEWVGTKYERFLTPDTMYTAIKFEKYLNQKITTQEKPKPSTGKTIEPYPEMQHLMDKDKA